MTKKKDTVPFMYGVFAVYRGDTNIMDGTAEQIQKKLGFTESTMRGLASVAYHKRVHENFHKTHNKSAYYKNKEHKQRLELVRIDTVEEDEVFGTTQDTDNDVEIS